ncbi:MAG: hypothetical protein MR543_08945 [Robinsoniella sp.]|nr:hypothetical protein [Robinsoniella sp.]
MVRWNSFEDRKIEALFCEVHEKRYGFEFEVKTRFADFFGGGSLHFSKCFEYFEMARFDILELFESYRAARGRRDSMEKIYFVVVKADYEKMDNVGMCGNLRVQTQLIVEKIPYLGFRQSLTDMDGREIYAKTEMKIALVDQEMRRIERWKEELFFDMISFVKDMGRREDGSS